MSTKEIKIKVTIDQAQYQQVDSMLQRLEQRANNIAKAFGNAGSDTGRGSGAGGTGAGNSAPAQGSPGASKGAKDGYSVMVDNFKGASEELAKQLPKMEALLEKKERLLKKDRDMSYEQYSRRAGVPTQGMAQAFGTGAGTMGGFFGNGGGAGFGQVPFAGAMGMAKNFAGQVPGGNFLMNHGLAMAPYAAAAYGVKQAGGMAFNAISDDIFGGNFENYEQTRNNAMASRVHMSRTGDPRLALAQQALRQDGMKSRAMQNDVDWESGIIKSSWRAIRNADMTEWSDGKRDLAAGNVIRSWQDRQMDTDKDKDEVVYAKRMQENVRSDLSNIHALGWGGTRRDGKNKKGSTAREFLTNAYFSEGEIMGMHQGIESAGSLRVAPGLTYSALSASAGGLRGAGAIYGGMSRGLGAKGALNFGNALLQQNQDVSAMNQLGGFITHAQMSGSGFTDGLGMLGAMQTGIGTGDAAMYRTAQNISGVRGVDRLLGGKQDSFQKGTNLLNAMAVNPGGGMYQNSFMANNLDFKSVASVLGGGGLTDAMKSAGLTKEMVKQFAEKTDKSSMNRFVDNAGQRSSPMLNTLRKIQASGGSISSYLKGLKGEEQESAINDVGLFKLQSGQADSFDEGVGATRLSIGLGSRASTGGGKRGGGGKGTVEGEASEQIIKDLEKYNDAYRIGSEKYLEAIQKIVFAADLHQAVINGQLKEAEVNSFSEQAFRLRKIDGNQGKSAFQLVRDAQAGAQRADENKKAAQEAQNEAIRQKHKKPGWGSGTF